MQRADAMYKQLVAKDVFELGGFFLILRTLNYLF